MPHQRGARAEGTARRRVVVVGASLAGLTVAEALRSEGSEDAIIVVGAEPDLPYGRPPLSKQVLHGLWEPEATALRSPAELDDRGIEVRTGTRIDRVDVDGHELVAGDERIGYDVLVIATGVTARSVHGALVLRTLDDARELRRRMSTAERVVVVGGGVLGSEIASGARKAGLPTTLVARSARLSLGSVGTALSDRLVALHWANGVDVRLGVGDVRVDVCANAPDGAARGVRLADGTLVPGDLVVAAIGGRPATEWLDGTRIDHRDGVRCDADGRAQDVDGAVLPDVYAVGDVAAWIDPRTGAALRVEHQTNAIEQGLAVAATIVHGTGSHPPTPFFWSELHGVRIQAAGRFAPASARGRGDTPAPAPEPARAGCDATPPTQRDTAFDGGVSSGERCPVPALVPLPGTDPDHPVLVATSADGTVTGVVGWHAARAFREARALLDRTPATT
jgi:NADPH-dependent 2,4-dienoyl-CoA reductase/sulfur reductase-like enzyme